MAAAAIAIAAVAVGIARRGEPSPTPRRQPARAPTIVSVASAGLLITAIFLGQALRVIWIASDSYQGAGEATYNAFAIAIEVVIVAHIVPIALSFRWRIDPWRRLLAILALPASAAFGLVAIVA